MKSLSMLLGGGGLRNVATVALRQKMLETHNKYMTVSVCVDVFVSATVVALAVALGTSSARTEKKKSQKVQD